MSSPRRLTVAPNIRSKAVTHRVPIEQRIARGDTVLAICKALRVSEDDVCDVWLRMERINEHTDGATHRQARIIGQRTHGTYGGYRQHKRKGTAPCADCKTAYAEQRRSERRGVA